VPLAVKDLFDTAGLTTTYGSAIFAGHVLDRSAEAVVRLERAGYVNVGKTNLHEFAYGVTSQNPHFGTVPNPIAPGRIAGGSSGGSAAALAAGLADAALGTDSGGSIRIPAACCAIVGFKPTFGLVPLEGVFPLAPTFDHAGPMARSIADCARMMEALVPGFEVQAAGAPKVGLAWTELCEPLVRARVEEAGAAAGAEALAFPLPDDVGRMFMREVADVHRELFAEHADSYGENVRSKIENCLAVNDDDADTATRLREELRERYLELTADVDLVVTPTVPFVSPPADVDERTYRVRGISLTYPFNCVGWPALALPCGTAEDGLPASLQIVGKPGDDALVLAAGASLVRGTVAA
jgi:aspartyl-tRNA(Asn)/glutamyl-tRNA(Gln) amidotransferase subunit A